MTTTYFYIPSPSYNKEFFLVSIAGVQFTVKYDYNDLMDLWFLTLIYNNEIVINAVPLVRGVIYSAHRVGFPLENVNSSLELISNSGDNNDAGMNNFGKDVFLVYKQVQ